MTESEIPYTERELIQRAVDQALSRDRGLGNPRWGTIKRTFAVGSSVARAICWKYGYDPEAIV